MDVTTLDGLPAHGLRVVPCRRLSSDERETMVRRAAYCFAQARDFAPGFEIDDWLRAEALVARACESELY